MDNKCTNLFISRAKIFLLAGLLGGMSACKDNIEPQLQETQQTAQTNKSTTDDSQTSQNSQDSFMKHMSNIGATSFYSGKYVNFSPTTNGENVSGLSYIERGYNELQGWHYGSENVRMLNRSDFASTDQTASFDVNNYNFFVQDKYIQGKKTYQIWTIENVPEDDYNEKFDGLSNTALAQIAKDSLNAVNADAAYVDNIYNTISDNKGNWTLDNGKICLVSKGNTSALKYSDYGFKQGPKKVAGEPAHYETAPYIGGMDANRTGAPSKGTHFYGTAFVSVMPTDDYYYANAHGGIVGTHLHVFKTDSLGARYTHGATADTLIMPFLEWYKVMFVKEHNSNRVEMVFASYPWGTYYPELQWGTKWGADKGPVDANTAKAPNGLVYSSYVSESPEYSVYFSMSEPLYYGKNKNTTTGIENVYCNAPKQNKASNTIDPTEVVVSVEYREYRTDADGFINGVEMIFVFGGHYR